MYINFNSQLSSCVPLTARGTFTVSLRIECGNVEHVGLYLDYAVLYSATQQTKQLSLGPGCVAQIPYNAHMHIQTTLTTVKSPSPPIPSGHLVAIIKKPEKVLILL